MPDPLIFKTDMNRPSFNIGVILGKKQTKGDVGLEIEVEGNKFPKPEGYSGSHNPVKMPNDPVWSYVYDGSLRGQDNAEYVLTKPIAFKEVPVAVNKIFNTMKEYGSVLDESNRTSIHVHLNCQEFHLNRLTSFIAMWFALEEVLTEFCGEHRVGNLFCLRAVDAPAIITYLKNFIKSDGEYQLNDILHYSGLNPNALNKHGSIEIRTLQGCSDPQVIINWVSVLERLYVLSGDFKDPRDIPAMFSSGGPLSFFDKLLGDKASLIRASLSWNDNDIAAAMFRGVRFAQEICYCRDWDEFSTIELKDDPFGRDSRKLASKIVQAMSESPVTIHNNVEYDEYPPEPDDQEMTPAEFLQSVVYQPTPILHAPAQPAPTHTGSWLNANFTTGGNNG